MSHEESKWLNCLLLTLYTNFPFEKWIWVYWNIWVEERLIESWIVQCYSQSALVFLTHKKPCISLLFLCAFCSIKTQLVSLEHNSWFQIIWSSRCKWKLGIRSFIDYLLTLPQGNNSFSCNWCDWSLGFNLGFLVCWSILEVRVLRIRSL